MTNTFPLLLALMVAAPPEEPIPSSFKSCFDGTPMEPAGESARVRAEEVEAARRAFAATRSYRACFSYISLFQGASWGAFEYGGPERRRWRLRYRGRQDSDPVGTLEVVRIGADTWFHGEGRWTRLPPGRKLQDSVPAAAWLPDPPELVKGLFEESPAQSFTGGGSAKAKAGACRLWVKAARRDEPSIGATVCVGSRDRLPYRISAGGPGIEAYMQVEVYDYAAPVDIRPPQ